MKLYIVVDTKGSGRLVGAFDSLAAAEALSKAYPAYYKLHVVALNEINREALGWTDDDTQREFLEKLIAEERKGG